MTVFRVTFSLLSVQTCCWRAQTTLEITAAARVLIFFVRLLGFVVCFLIMYMPLVGFERFA